MKTRYLLCAVTALTLAACSKSDTTPVDSALAVNPNMAIPLDSVTAAEQARAANLAAPVTVAPAAPVRTRVVYRDRPVSSSSGSSSTSSGSSNAGTHIEKNTKRDAAIGAAAGAVIGGATGGVKGAVIGGAAGAVLGGVIGNNVDKKRKKN